MYIPSSPGKSQPQILQSLVPFMGITRTIFKHPHQNTRPGPGFLLEENLGPGVTGFHNHPKTGATKRRTQVSRCVNDP